MFKKSKARTVESTIKLLAAYHAVPLDNKQFIVQYRHLIAMYYTLCKSSNITPIF